MGTKSYRMKVIRVIEAPVDDSCISGIEQKKKTKNETSTKEYAEISEIKKLYDSVKKRKITSMRAIQCLERVTRCEFSCTKDFCNKMESFLEKHYYRGVDLRKAMKQNGMKHSDLANMLGVSINTIKKMLTNQKSLSQDAIDFIKAMGLEKTVPLKKMKKNSSEANHIQNRKNDKIPPEKKLKKLQVSDKIKCGVCNKDKDEGEVTIEYINPYRTEFIYEDCISNKETKIVKIKDGENELRKAT